MNRTGKLVRRTPVDRVGHAPSGPVDPDESASHKRSVVAMTVAASVVVLIVAVFVAVHRESDSHRSALSSRVAHLPRHVNVPAGSRVASFGTLSLRVPAGLPTRTSLCGRPVADEVVAAATHAELCPTVAARLAADPGAVVWFSVGRFDNPYSTIDTEPARVDGVPVRRGFATDHPRLGHGVSGVVELHNDKIIVGVTAPTRAAVNRVLGSLRIGPIDPYGCAARLASAISTQPGSSQVLLATGAEAALRCEYADRAPGTGVLIGSYELEHAATTRLTTALRMLRPDPCRCVHGGTPALGENEVLYLRYRGRRPSVRIDGTVGANLDHYSNGSRSVANFDSSIARLLGRLTDER